MGDVRESAERISAALRQSIGMLTDDGAARKNYAEIDAQIMRDELESVVEVETTPAPHWRDPCVANWRGNVKTASDNELLAVLGLPPGEEGKTQFRDRRNVHFAVRRHALKLPHICGDWCPLEEEPLTFSGPEERN
jgi:hypothetical protein